MDKHKYQKPKDIRKEFINGIWKMSNKPKRPPPPPKTRKYFEIKKKKS